MGSTHGPQLNKVMARGANHEVQWCDGSTAAYAWDRAVLP